MLVSDHSFVNYYYLCQETNGLPIFCENSGMTYHKVCFIAKVRIKTKEGSISQLVEQEYEDRILK